MASSQDKYKVIEAGPEHIPSLKTIFARSFHPVKEFHKKAAPDTQVTRDWWGDVQTANLKDPKERVLVLVDSTASDNEVYGVLNMHRFDPDERGIGFWTDLTFSKDHNKEMYMEFINFQRESREKLMMGREHYVISLFGVDHAVSGKGLGKMMLGRCCEILDGEGLAVMVETNSEARHYYPKFGFKENEEALPGKYGYSQHILVREPQKKQA